MTFHKYPKIKCFGDRDTDKLLEDHNDVIYIEEKIDGANFRFMPTEDNRIIFGSHNQSIGDNTNEIGGTWKRCTDFILDRIKDKDVLKYAGYIFYGECCIPHSIQYYWDTMSIFIGYDVMKDDVFVSFEEKCKIFTELDLPIVKSYQATTAEYINNNPPCEDDIPNSAYGTVKAEGLVFKNYRTQTFIKYVSQKFKEVNKAKFGESKKFCANDNDKFIATYCTNARIDKHIFKLVDSGYALEMQLMKYLPSVIWNDIVEECAVDILNENWTLDLRQCRKNVAKRCVAVLEMMISTQYVKNKAVEIEE